MHKGFVCCASEYSVVDVQVPNSSNDRHRVAPLDHRPPLGDKRCTGLCDLPAKSCLLPPSLFTICPERVPSHQPKRTSTASASVRYPFSLVFRNPTLDPSIIMVSQGQVSSLQALTNLWQKVSSSQTRHGKIFGWVFPTSTSSS